MPKRIAIDIDSTLHHYWDQFREVARRQTGVDLPYELQTGYAVGELTREQLHRVVVETHSEEHVLAAVPYPDAVETVRAWHEAGHFIHITSHRSTDAHDQTVRWLNKVDLPFDELYCSYDKVTRCVEIGIDILIDDAPSNLVNAAEKGIHGATLWHPWNADTCERSDITCAQDWNELRDALAPRLGT